MENTHRIDQLVQDYILNNWPKISETPILVTEYDLMENTKESPMTKISKYIKLAFQATYNIAEKADKFENYHSDTIAPNILISLNLAADFPGPRDEATLTLTTEGLKIANQMAKIYGKPAFTSKTQLISKNSNK